MIYTIKGKGNAGRRNGIPGDIQLVINEKPDSQFVRKDKDIIYNLLLSFPQAALGCMVDIPTLSGKSRIKIEPGTQPGKVLRLREKGIPPVKGYDVGTGDLVVKISVYVPEKLSSKEKELIEQIQECENLQPSESIQKKIFEKFKTFFN